MPDLVDQPTATVASARPRGGGASGDNASKDPTPGSIGEPVTFKLYQHGELTVIGWDGAAEIDPDPAEFQQEAADLIVGAAVTTLAVDLTRLECYPPGLLGGLSSLVRRGTRVLAFNPTDDVREILRATSSSRCVA
ncbi:MAG: hypothetical protein AAF907_00555, partial [Planctomycetota bacterium]